MIKQLATKLRLFQRFKLCLIALSCLSPETLHGKLRSGHQRCPGHTRQRGESRYLDWAVERDRFAGLGNCRRFKADSVIFNADRIIDRVTFELPAQASDGIISVRVNGKPAWRDQAPARIRNGRFLTH